MKLIFSLLIFSLILFVGSCTNGKKDKSSLIEEGTMMVSAPIDTCLCDDLLLNDSGVLYQNDTLFTGICIYNYPNSDIKYMIKSVLAGKLHGTITYFNKLGEVLFEEIYENGSKKRTGDGAPLECDCSDLEIVKNSSEEIKRSLLDGIPFSGKCIKKYKNTNTTYMEVAYKDGLHDGFTIFYDKEGNTMYMEKYEIGVLIKVIHEVD